MTNSQETLPPGFRFHPTDEELILHYLRNKIISTPLPVSIIAEVDIYKFDPWDLPGKAKFGEKEWYFFSPRERKYPNGARPNRAAASGYWKATGTDKTINVATSSSGGGLVNIGVKKALVYYEGRPPRGIKTNWIMHEYRLANALNKNYGKPSKLKDSSMTLDDWVLCRIYKKHNGSAQTIVSSSDHDQEGEEPSMLQASNTYDHQDTNKNCTLLQPQRSSSFSNLVDSLDYSMLSSFLNDTNQSTAGIDPLFTNSMNSNMDDQLMYNSPTYCTNDFNSIKNSMENMLKQQGSNRDEDLLYPSKKSGDSVCSTSTQSNITQLNHPFFSQQLMWGPHLQY